jgi:hypothetical protein
MIKFLTISLTNQCDKDCSYCPIADWRNNKKFPDKLTLESTIKFIDRAKPTHIEITGGEPTMVDWLWDLCEEIEGREIIYLVKSNGHKRCPNQISAWHGLRLPEHYGKMLIIKDTYLWQMKVDYCRMNRIPYRVIGKDKDDINASKDPSGWIPTQQLFLCPDGHVKMCHEHEVLMGEAKTMEDDIQWVFTCVNCKAVNDFMIFLEG